MTIAPNTMWPPGMAGGAPNSGGLLGGAVGIAPVGPNSGGNYAAGGIMGYPIQAQQGRSMNYSEDTLRMKYDAGHLLRMIRTRLHLDVGVHDGHFVPMPFQFIACHKVNEEQAVVFVVANGEPVMLRDPLDLFPSDTLMTQLRLLRSDK